MNAIVQAVPISASPELIKVLRSLTPRQRKLLKSLPKYNGHLWKAAIEMGIGRASLHSWLKRENFRRAKEMLEEIECAALPVSRMAILQDVIEVKERCMQATPVFDHEGKPTGEWTFDGKTSLRALELLGKHKRLWGEDKPKQEVPVGPGLTVVVQNGGQVAIQQNVSANRVEVKLPRPA